MGHDRSGGGDGEGDRPGPVEPWEVLEETERGHFRVFSIKELRCRSPRTRLAHGFYVLESADWVNVIPITPDGEMVLIRQYRHGIREITLEIPGGMIDPGESPAEAAAREMLEETGYRSDPLIPLGRISPNPAIQSNWCYTFLAPNARPVAALSLDHTEEIDVIIVPRAEIARLVATGAINHALVVVALYALELHDRGLIAPR